MEQEQWKPIQEFNGEYEVSNLGRVRSMKRYYGMVGHIMPQTIQCKGYYAVTFWMNNKAYCRKVHRLVIEAFTPNPDSLPCINHIDGNKLNNHEQPRMVYLSGEHATCRAHRADPSAPMDGR